MRAYKRLGKEGFTLVELMIVVAIIGVLAALAIYGVNRYLASAKTSEAKNTIGAISRGAAAAYERETSASEILVAGANSTATSNSLCATATIVPAAVPAGTKYQPNQTEGTDFETGDSTTGWKCLKFSMSQPIYYQYRYASQSGFLAPAGAPPLSGNAFEAAAVGDLDGDGVQSNFVRGGVVNASTRALSIATQVFILNEFE